MHIELNGEPREVTSATLTALIEELGFARERIAVELNREVIRRKLWDETTLRDGDKIEIVHFVGGGRR